ncbi:hypothetical protein [Photobacterium frigidiphilum]|nr:hypothetical protein [Photobacterium frigidiphilum]
MAVNHGSVFKKREKRVYLTFEKALEHKGYLSLRSIIESQYSFPRTYVIEPIRNVNIVPRIKGSSITLLSQQASIGQYSGRPRPSSLTDTRLGKLRDELGSAVHQLSKKIV